MDQLENRTTSDSESIRELLSGILFDCEIIDIGLLSASMD